MTFGEESVKVNPEPTVCLLIDKASSHIYSIAWSNIQSGLGCTTHK